MNVLFTKGAISTICITADYESFNSLIIPFMYNLIFLLGCYIASFFIVQDDC